MTINEAILKVITSQFKKDEPEAFKTVEKAGYRVYKVDGHFVVKNGETGRYVTTNGHTPRYFGGGVYGYFVDRGWHYKQVAIAMGTRLKFDFVGCLEKPYPEYRRPVARPTIEKYRKLQDAKRSVNYADERIEELQKKIQRLTDELVSAAEYRNQREHNLAIVKREIGLW